MEGPPCSRCRGYTTRAAHTNPVMGLEGFTVACENVGCGAITLCLKAAWPREGR